ncbi:YceD family protein [Spiribacter onubensis]|uniref:Large ribosomal RNA subunit accumulation protein YceD n=1 Tax=Spiribacter onubensis TaxID=3122420 RepID=A0ABV3S7X7_9GAMM
MTELPARIELDRLARGRHEWSGSLPAGATPRLAELEASLGSAGASFSVDIGQGRPRIEGNCQGSVTVRCERCLEPMEVTVAGEFALVAVDRIEEADGLGVEDPVVVATKGQLDVLSMIEDELILGLPVVSRHERADCDGGQRHFGPPGESEPTRDNPFKVLESLRKDGSGDAY